MAKRKLDSTTETDTGRDAQPKRSRALPPSSSSSQPDNDSYAAGTSGPVTDTDFAMPQPAQEEQSASKEKRSREEDGGQASGSRVEKERKPKVRKLAPPRPFPTVPASVSATGPRSAHTEGKNYICITRRTELGAYLRRCKDVFLKDGCVLLPS